MSAFEQLDKLQRLAFKTGETRRVFIGSMMDIFEKPMPAISSNGEMVTDTGKLRTVLFKRIEQGRYPDLIFLLLTKRPSNILKYIPEGWKNGCPENVMFGTSVVNQSTADKLIPQLLEVPGYLFLSIEPQLDELTLKQWIFECTIHWVIQGGESGPKRRPFNVDWGRKLRDECFEADVPYFFKQVDKVIPIPDDLMVKEHFVNIYKTSRKLNSNY